MNTQETVKAALLKGIEQHATLAGERKIRWMESQVLNLDAGRIILYGANIFEGPMIEYHGHLGDWRSAMTSTLRLRGELRQEAGVQVGVGRLHVERAKG
jgi:hypothetical protein